MILPKQKIRFSSQKGSVLVFAMIILSLILISALSMASTSLTQLKSTNISGRSTAALQNADRGLENVLQSIYNERSAIETLDDLVGPGGLTDMRCVNGRIVAKLGLTSPFEIAAYHKPGISSPYTQGSFEEIDGNGTGDLGCNTFLGDIVQFRVIGEDNRTARALGVTLRDPVERGLIAYWGFEDNARAKETFGAASGGSPTVADGSRNNHIFTLCPADNAPHGTSIPFDRCPQILTPADVTPTPSVPIDEIYMEHDGSAFVPGIVDEIAKLNGAPDPPTYHSEAIYFNGTSTYLAINNTEDTTPSTSYYDVPPQFEDVRGAPAANYVDDADNELNVEDAISISLFVRKDTTGDQPGILVINGTAANTSGDNGYALYFADNGKLRVRIQGTIGSDGQAEANYPDDGQWHHVVMMWDRNAPPGRGLHRPEIYIDGYLVSAATSGRTRAMDYVGLPFTVGGIYDGTDISLYDTTLFRSDPSEPGFNGAIDELRIYDRALTPNEIKVLCAKAGSPLQANCNS